MMSIKWAQASGRRGVSHAHPEACTSTFSWREGLPAEEAWQPGDGNILSIIIISLFVMMRASLLWAANI